MSNRSRERGFTLVEMLVSIAIIGALAVVVIARYSTFDSTILLKNAALDAAATIRQAQVLSVSVQRGDGGGFHNAYGVSFMPEEKQYTLFRFYDSANSFPQRNSFAQNVIDPIAFNTSIRIADICIFTSGGPSNGICRSAYPDKIDRLDVSFRRPEFKALFHVEDPTGDIDNPDNTDDGNIESVRIHLQSVREPGNEYAIEVGLLGHISVIKP